MSESDPKPSIGFVGLGNMGGPMCRRLVGANFHVTAFDLDAEALDRAVDGGAHRGSSATDLASSVDILMTSLPEPRHVDGLMDRDGTLAALRPGSIWVDLTTNRRALVERLAAAAPPGVGVVDSPVTGAVDGARTGRLTLFAGGAPSDLHRVRPVLSELGRVIDCGPLGTGNVVKLVTNQLWFIHAAAIGEGFALGLANGVELPVLYDAICDSVGDSFVARHDAPSIFAGHYDPSFTLALCLKDLGLLDELAQCVGADLPMTAAAHGAFDDSADRYGAGAGEMHVARRLEDDASLSFRLDGPWTAPWDVESEPTPPSS
ncbi:NAD(P)-dependent oxidoreductase [Ilumatobacter nonamiensis]|uniref:NAD(P)-dependent oxidoreductase n=1 Tax=Ilumatobacter nonamiensis TaxID=467093 RepID=UPI0006887FA0|nr:NAD(P)-dependent oxidoreductase [Ilumatobacter nonamiensis]